MGGSALPGLLLESYARVENLPLAVATWNNYGLPRDSIGALIIAISYSGNTEETLSAYAEAIKRKLPVVALATGGKLLQEARRRKLAFVSVPETIAPRFCLGYFFGALLAILKNTGVWQTDPARFKGLSRRLSSKKISQASRRLIRPLQNKIVLIYTSHRWQALGQIWKAALNETCKIPAFRYSLPELNHNEMEGFSGSRALNRHFVALFLEDENDPAKIKRRSLLTRRIFQKEAGLKSFSIKIEGRTFLEKAIFMSLFSYWTSYFLARKLGQDPLKYNFIEKLKRLIK